MNQEPEFLLLPSTASAEFDAPEIDGNTKWLPDALYPPPYFVLNGNLYVEEDSRKGLSVIHIANFTPWIERVITYDNGTDTVTKYAVRGRLAGGRELPEIILDGDEITAFNWIVTRWDTECNISTQPRAKEHLRFAFQETTKRAERLTCYTTTGWHKTTEGWRYLLPGDDVCAVELEGKLRHYRGERGATDTDYRVLRDLLTADFIPPDVLLPGMAMVFLSPLNTFLRLAGYEPKFILLLTGRTGSMKSTVAALLLSFFGQFTATDLPMSFHDTANSMVKKTFVLKDVLSCADDYHPTTGSDVAEMRRLMQNLARAVGDRMDRGRLDANLAIRNAQPPQGNILVTAEHQPDVGESGVARFFTLEMGKGISDLDVLTRLQHTASDGALRRHMAAYTERIRDRYLDSNEAVEAFAETLGRMHEAYRAECLKVLSDARILYHGRTADAVAGLRIGFDFLIDFLADARPQLMGDRQRQKDAFRDLIHALALRQSAAVASDRPAHIFVTKLLALLECGDVELPEIGSSLIRSERCVGYCDRTFYYIQLTPAHRAVKKLCDAQGECFPISSQGLAKALADEGLIHTAGGNTKTKRIGNKNIRVMLLYRDKADKLYASAEGM